MGLIYLLMTYVSALKNYKEIAQSFIVGMGTVIGLVLLTKEFLYQNDAIVVYLIFYFALGTLLTLIGLYMAVRKVFKQMNGNYFEFLLYFKKYPKLFFSNVAYTITLYAHNFLFWNHPATKQQVSVFHFPKLSIWPPPLRSTRFCLLLSCSLSARRFFSTIPTARIWMRSITERDRKLKNASRRWGGACGRNSSTAWKCEA